MKTFAYIAQSIDGFIAKPDGNLDWLDHNSYGEDYGFREFLRNIDVILMGANTFSVIMNFDEWVYTNKKVFIMSNKIKTEDIPERLRDKVEISNLSPRKIITVLREKGCQEIYVDGGKVIQSFLKEDLVDELIITQIPILLGDGIPLFGKLNREIKLELVENQSFKSGLIQNRYKIIHY